MKFLITPVATAALALGLSMVGCTKSGQMNTAVEKSDTAAPAVGQVGAPGDARPAEVMPKDSADASQDLKAAQTPVPTPVAK